MKRSMLLSPALRARIVAHSLSLGCVALVAFASLPKRQQAATCRASAALHFFTRTQPNVGEGIFVPAGNTITVNSVGDIANSTDGLCTLREAITAANTNTASGATAGECAAGDSSGSDT